VLTSSNASSQQSTSTQRTRKAFSHPFHDGANNEIIFNVLTALRSFNHSVGPEMVSAHYENFAMSRKYALTLWGGLFVLSYVATHQDVGHLATSLMIPYMFWFGLFYFALEAKKSLIKPFQTEFYIRVANQELTSMLSYWNDNMREAILQKQVTAQEQIDYYTVHTDYHSIKSESINRFLAIEQINLKQHIQTRALRLLQSAEQMEVSNQRYLINSIVSEAIAQVDKTLNENLDNIQDSMFDCALIGIKNQRMTYENDPLLPLISQKIQAKISSLSKLTQEEKVKLVQLTNDQLEGLKTLDRQIRDEFLRKVPKIDQSLKAYPQVKKALDNWGRESK